jgi:hypothetical protein
MTLPPELNRFAHLQFIKKRGHNEWSAECPRCGDVGHVGSDWPDRFRMWGGKNARGWCRACQYFEWADDGQFVSPMAKMRIMQEHKQRVAAERERVRRKIHKMQEEAYWKGFHDAMTETERKHWRKEGIPDGIQDWFTLGYLNDKIYMHNDEKMHSPALSIPFDKAGEIVNVQFKLLSPAPNAGKYRFTSNLPPAYFLTEPKRELKGNALVVEGAKKAIILWMHVGEQFDHVIGLPSKYPPRDMLDDLAKFSQVTLMLDPDAYTDETEHAPCSAHKIANNVDTEVRVVQTFTKPDDIIVLHGGSASDIKSLIRQARPVS